MPPPPSKYKAIERRVSILTDLLARSSTSTHFLEKKVRPTIIIAMLYFKEPSPDIEALRSLLGDRLLHIPQFSSLFHLRDDKVFCHVIPKSEVDLKYHIRSMDGRNTFNADDISEMISRASQKWWDASKPLWQITLIRNMADGRSMLFVEVDHCLGDGIAMLSVLMTLLDYPPKNALSFQYKRPTLPSVPWETKVAWFFNGIYFGIIGWALGQADPENGLKIPKDKKIGDAGSKTFTELQPYSLSTLKKMSSRMTGVSINDLLMSSVTMGIRHYFEKTRDPILIDINRKGTKLHAISVINTRHLSNPHSKHQNDFAPVHFMLPLRSESEIETVWKVKKEMDYIKVSPTLRIVKYVTWKALQALPESMLIRATLENSRKPSCMVSNLVGPQSECSIGGYIVDDITFLASTVVGLYVGAISYNGWVRISFTTDKLANIDCGLLKSCFEGAMKKLERAVLTSSNRQIEQPDVRSALLKAAGFCASPLCVLVVAAMFHFALSRARTW